MYSVVWYSYCLDGPPVTLGKKWILIKTFPRRITVDFN